MWYIHHGRICLTVSTIILINGIQGPCAVQIKFIYPFFLIIVTGMEGGKMKKHKSRGLALLLAVAMVFQFCIFSSQSAWAGNINVDAASEEQMQDTGTAPEGDAALDDGQEAAPVDEAADDVTTDSEEPGVSDAEEPEAVEEETPGEQTEDVEEPAAEQEQPT